MFEDDGYTGAATLVVGEQEFAVDVELRGHFQPIDGHYHWYGRIRANPRLHTFANGRKHPVVLRTADGEATGEISDPDVWQRYRVTGTSRPPFAVPESLADIEG